MSFKDIEFPAADKQDWLDMIAKDLKGKPIHSLTFNLRGGITLNAAYHRSDFVTQDSVPGMPPYFRGNAWENNAYLHQQEFDLDQPGINGIILSSLNHNINSIRLTGSAFKDALKDVNLSWIRVAYAGNEPEDFITFCSEQTNEFTLDIDPFLFGTGKGLSYKRVTELKTTYPIARFISVNGNNIANAGGSVTTELCYSLLAGHEHIVQLLELGMDLQTAADTLTFNLATGPDYYVETAKIRAFRRLWASVIDAYGPSSPKSYKCHITSETTLWNKIPVDKENNILRATTEAMSGILGGADVVQVNPTNFSDNSATFNARIAANILNLLEEESYFETVADPAGGSYVIESLTDQIVDIVWEMFREYESEGGISTVLSTLTRNVAREQAELIERIDKGEVVLIGGNKYRREGDQFSSDDIQFTKTGSEWEG